MNSINQLPKATRSPAPLIVSGLVILLLAGAGVTIWILHGTKKANPSTNGSGQSLTPSQAPVSTPPPTPTSTSGTPASSTGNTAANPKSNASGESTPSSTSLTITSIDQSVDRTTSISSYINAVVNNGTCTFTFTQGSSVVTRTTDVAPNASTSSCATLTIGNSAFPNLGTWQLVVSFASGSLTAQSSPQTVVLK